MRINIKYKIFFITKILLTFKQRSTEWQAWACKWKIKSKLAHAQNLMIFV